VVIPFPPLRLSEFLVNRFLSRCDKRAHILWFCICFETLLHVWIWSSGTSKPTRRKAPRNISPHPMADALVLNPFRSERPRTNETGRRQKANTVARARQRTVPRDRCLLAKLAPTFADWRVPRGQRDGSLRPYLRLSRPESILFLPSSSVVVLTRLSGPRSRRTISMKISLRRESNPEFWICSQELWPLDHRGGQWNRTRKRSPPVNSFTPSSGVRLVRDFDVSNVISFLLYSTS
jgi:hypothetical protein